MIRLMHQASWNLGDQHASEKIVYSHLLIILGHHHLFIIFNIPDVTVIQKRGLVAMKKKSKHDIIWQNDTEIVEISIRWDNYIV